MAPPIQLSLLNMENDPQNIKPELETVMLVRLLKLERSGTNYREIFSNLGFSQTYSSHNNHRQFGVKVCVHCWSWWRGISMECFEAGCSQCLKNGSSILYKKQTLQNIFSRLSYKEQLAILGVMINGNVSGNISESFSPQRRVGESSTFYPVVRELDQGSMVGIQKAVQSRSCLAFDGGRTTDGDSDTGGKQQRNVRSKVSSSREARNFLQYLSRRNK